MTKSKKKHVANAVRAMTAQELADCVKEVITWQDKGMLSEGALYKLASQFMTAMGTVKISSIEKAGSAVLREASLRFTEAQTGYRVD